MKFIIILFLVFPLLGQSTIKPSPVKTTKSQKFKTFTKKAIQTTGTITVIGLAVVASKGVSIKIYN